MRLYTESVPWERRPGESRQAYAAFGIYRDMGPHKRSTVKVAHELCRSKTLMDRWSSRWSWVSRADTWDAEQERIRVETMRARQIQAAEDDFQLGAALAAKAASNLLTLADKGLTPHEIARLAHVGVEIKRLALGMPTKPQQTTAAVPQEPHNGNGDLVAAEQEAAALSKRILDDSDFSRVASEFFSLLSSGDNKADPGNSAGK